MERRAKYILVAIALTFISSAMAQQTRQTNMYRYNMYAVNPAYAGYSGCTEINFSHLNQWVKIDGAPTTNFFSANTRLGKSLGIGANVLIDRLGMFQQISAAGSVSYGFKGLELSFASKQLIETRSNFNYPDLDGYGLKRHFIGYAGYSFILNKNFSLTPSVLYKGVNNVNQLDLNVDVNYNDFIYGGLGYRTGVGLLGRIGINIRKMFFIGYAYEVPMQNIASYSAGSHEIAIGLKLCRKKKEDEHLTAVDPVKASIDTVTVVETITDTLIVEKIDTVYIKEPSNDEVRKAMMQAAEHLEFENDKAIILKGSHGDLESLTNILLMREELDITLEGHTDSNGTEEYNMRLSKNRVEAVKDFLVANGVDAKRIKTSHFGESKPIADNKTEEGRAKNRRVDMEVLNR